MLIDQNQIRFRVFIKDKLKICNSMLSDIVIIVIMYKQYYILIKSVSCFTLTVTKTY